MISLPSGTRIWLVAGVTDMRKSFNGHSMHLMKIRSPGICLSSVAAKGAL
ncbi:Putative transposase [Klebsiella pneumoniae]|nr:Putative transposase [Klebsiella pneumoniae]